MGANKVVQKSKEAKMKAAMAGGKSKKKKWSKGKVKEKLANLVMFDQATYDKMLKEIPKAKLITTAIVSERLKVNGSVARQAIRHLEEKDLIQVVGERTGSDEQGGYENGGGVRHLLRAFRLGPAAWRLSSIHGRSLAPESAGKAGDLS
ncbi:unnamed protein product [Prorocentrum cordatum]|uniref:40S ribosomal protein S25 n=1 Tax=Prorocentrum cordatum TaxID=2364126 RepID=A0ABN9RAR1_9DINO|nr:unnamed protein product [Polarella glacialis]